MEKMQWRVEFTTPPKTYRYCKKCGAKTEYVSTGLFRVNANQKNLDVWLIYRCHKCKTTWNSTILSRINTKSIEDTLLEKFQNNDAELALFYAMDTEILKRNGAETENPVYRIVGADVDLNHSIQIEILCSYPTKIKLSKVLRDKLGLSNRAYEEMLDNGYIQLGDGTDIRKAKLHHDYVVFINKEEVHMR